VNRPATAYKAFGPELDALPRRPLRICMVHYSDFHVDSRIQRQARALAERGDEVDLVCLSTSGEERAGPGVIRIHSLGEDKAAGRAGSYLRGYAGFLVRALRVVASLDKRHPFDLVEAHNMPDVLVFAALRPKLRGTPVILNIHDTFPELFATKFNRPLDGAWARLIRAQERISSRFADAVVTVTPEAGDILERRGSAPQGVNVVMNSPDETVFGPARAPAPFPAEGPIRAIYHGGLAPRFGVELLVEAMGLLSSAVDRLELRICGTGSDQARIAGLAEERAPSRVLVASAPIPFREIPGELLEAQLGVVPTLRDDFTQLLLPVKLLEYVHMGLPAVAPRLPVIERYFNDAEIAFFEPGSAPSLAQAIEETCAEPDLARARAERASERLEEIAWPVQRRAYLRLVDDLVDARANGGAKRVGVGRKSKGVRAVRSRKARKPSSPLA
jgi:glycosyltransferase involved in cell wall biosynthesis